MTLDLAACQQAATWLIADPPDERLRGFLTQAGFREPPSATDRLRRTVVQATDRATVGDVLPTLLLCLADSAQPDHTLLNFERLVQNVPQPAGLLRMLAANPRGIEILLRLFVGSQFLSDILLTNPG